MWAWVNGIAAEAQTVLGNGHKQIHFEQDPEQLIKTVIKQTAEKREKRLEGICTLKQPRVLTAKGCRQRQE